MVLWRYFYSDAVSTALIHEIGHWLESYIKRHLDFYYHQRLTDQMRAELTHLGLSEYLLTYTQSNPYEFFAVSFEIFFYYYDLLKEQAPNIFNYLSYYLIEALKTYSDTPSLMVLADRD